MGRTRIIAIMIGLVLVASVAAACGGRGGSSSSAGTRQAAGTSAGGEAQPVQATIEVEMKDFRFHPAEIRIKAGTTVRFINRDPLAHDVVETTPERAASGAHGFHSPHLNTGESWTYTFDKAGTYPILCTVGGHYLLGMVGTIIVE